METEQVVVGENNVWISIDSLRIETQNGIEEQQGKFLCYVSFVQPSAFYGVILRDEINNIIFFENRQAAREAAITFATETL